MSHNLTFTADQRRSLRHRAEVEQSRAAMRDWFEALTPRQRLAVNHEMQRLAKFTGRALAARVRKLPDSFIETLVSLGLYQYDALVVEHCAARAGLPPDTAPAPQPISRVLRSIMN